MTIFGTGNFHVADTFHAVLGNPSFSAYTTSTFSDVSMTPVDFSKITQTLPRFFALKTSTVAMRIRAFLRRIF